MDNVKEFLDLEEEARKLSEGIKKVYDEAGSYKGAKEELSSTKEKLLELVVTTQKLTEDTHEIISSMKNIGMPEVLDRIEEMINFSNVVMDKMMEVGKEVATTKNVITEELNKTEEDIIKKMEKYQSDLESMLKEIKQSVNTAYENAEINRKATDDKIKLNMYIMLGGFAIILIVNIILHFVK